MRLGDVLLVVAVGGLAAFVAVQVVQRKIAESERPSVIPQAIVPPQSAPTGAAPAVAPHRDVAPAMARSVSPAPVRDLDAIRARIAGTPGTYMQGMLMDLNGQLVRWPDRREQGLRIWVQATSNVHDWSLQYTQMARDAFAEWGTGDDRGGVPVRLDFVFDSASSDIRIVWVDRFPPDLGRRVGSTQRTTDQYGWIVAAQISVAIHDSAGTTIRPEQLAGIVRHEAGHSLGLGHSTDPNTKMYPVEIVSDIRAADRATLRLLYQLPPGLVR